MSSIDSGYYRQRANEHRRLASRTREVNVAGLHLQLAKNYDDLAFVHSEQEIDDVRSRMGVANHNDGRPPAAQRG